MFKFECLSCEKECHPIIAFHGSADEPEEWVSDCCEYDFVDIYEENE